MIKILPNNDNDINEYIEDQNKTFNIQPINKNKVLAVEHENPVLETSSVFKTFSRDEEAVNEYITEMESQEYTCIPILNIKNISVLSIKTEYKSE